MGAYLRQFRQLLNNRAVLMIALSGTFRAMTQNGLLIFLPVYLAFEMGYSPLAVGLCLTLLQVAGFIAGPVGGHLSDRMGRKRVVMSSMAMTAVVIVAMVMAGRTPFFIFSIALLGFFLYATRPVLHAWAMESAPANMGGSTVGLQFALSATGAAIAPAVFGMLADRYSVYTGFYFLVGTIVVANLLIFFMPNGGLPAKAAPAQSH
jgi:sugar phosphate permease